MPSDFCGVSAYVTSKCIISHVYGCKNGNFEMKKCDTYFCSLITVIEQFHVIFYGNPVLRINRTALRISRVLSHFGPNHFGPGLLGQNHINWGSSGLHSLAIFFTLALVSKSRGLSASTTINYCQRVFHSK